VKSLVAFRHVIVDWRITLRASLLADRLAASALREIRETDFAGWNGK
jgi:hypothetical protein